LKHLSQKVVLDTCFVVLIAPTLLSSCTAAVDAGSMSRIINLSGTFEDGAKGWLPYYVSKKAIEDLTVGLAEELSGRGIRVSGISPSDTATEAYRQYFPEYIPDAIEPEEIAKFAIHLCTSDVNGKIFVLKKDREPLEAFHY
jgi:NAD(P)-dependent dehydrogenase (short-subunit alcohol dehydrogenase family)